MLAIEPPLPFPRTKCSIGAAATDEQPEAEPDQIGGYLRGHMTSQITLRN